MVECTGLENRRGLTPTVGSNPTSSAIFRFHLIVQDAKQPLMALFLFAYPYSLLPLAFLRLDSFLFIEWYEVWYIYGFA